MKISELTNAPQWLKDAIVENEDVEIVNNYVIWKDGTWKSGVWKSGRWEGGVWEDGKKVQQRQQPQPRKNGQGARSAQHLNDLVQQYADHGYVNDVAPVYGKMLKHGVFLAAMCML